MNINIGTTQFVTNLLDIFINFDYIFIIFLNIKGKILAKLLTVRSNRNKENINRWLSFSDLMPSHTLQLSVIIPPSNDRADSKGKDYQKGREQNINSLYFLGLFRLHHSSICTRTVFIVANASSTSSSKGSLFSSAITLSSSGFVLGCLGVNTVQQSS